MKFIAFLNYIKKQSHIRDCFYSLTCFLYSNPFSEIYLEIFCFDIPVADESSLTVYGFSSLSLRKLFNFEISPLSFWVHEGQTAPSEIKKQPQRAHLLKSFYHTKKLFKIAFGKKLNFYWNYNA